VGALSRPIKDGIMDKDTITTAFGHRFHATGEERKRYRLFTVNPDVPLVDALNSVSCLLSTLEDGVLDAAMGTQPLVDSAAWLAHHTLESAKAVVDSLIDCLESQRAAQQQAETGWSREGGFYAYFILDDIHIQRAPFGKFGPFPTANAMREALDNIETKLPDLLLVSRKARLAADLVNELELDKEHAKTLEKLRNLGA
jgi:hypothetical protein